MSIKIKIPTPLREITNGESTVVSTGENIKELILNMDKSYSGIYDRLINSTGEIFGFVNIYVNGEDVKYLEGLSTKLSSNDEITIVPAVAGG
ncbi:MAG: molybdopterin synthase sulfur carrier subunit [Chloroflexi bacterium]|nr:molybdopterin synthase sulfur carrier subunit [Chloroflexota bacterium]MBL00986.1 molybdopterin synthase sulfur carrier subunit [Chloroflexota bacterium]|tara:strand:+ start:7257 stop:7532 length:276 start_codon:yes stop_codon:yes gene_type:complete